MQLIEETFRRLVVSLEESQRARERSYVEAVGAIVTAADARDQETTGHSFRVALYAVELARSLGVSGDDLKAIEWVALLHDVGKMIVPTTSCAREPSRRHEWLSEEARAGATRFAEVSLSAKSLDLIYSSTRLGRQGYRAACQREIPGARIFAVLDTSTPSLPTALPARLPTQAMAELQRVAGQQLDPEAVAAFREIPEVELRRLRQLCKRVHPGLQLPADLLDRLSEPDQRAGALPN